MNAIEFYFRIEDTAPVRIDGGTKPPTNAQTEGMSYWAISLGAFGPYPPVLAHIYCPGPLPPEKRRDRLNAVAKARIGELLTGQRDPQHVDKP